MIRDAPLRERIMWFKSCNRICDCVICNVNLCVCLIGGFGGLSIAVLFMQLMVNINYFDMMMKHILEPVAWLLHNLYIIYIYALKYKKCNRPDLHVEVSLKKIKRK